MSTALDAWARAAEDGRTLGLAAVARKFEGVKARILAERDARIAEIREDSLARIRAAMSSCDVSPEGIITSRHPARRARAIKALTGEIYRAMAAFSDAQGDAEATWVAARAAWHRAIEPHTEAVA